MKHTNIEEEKTITVKVYNKMYSTHYFLSLFLVLFVMTCVYSQTTLILDQDPLTSLDPRLAKLCALPVNDYYCCKLQDPAVDIDLRCQFLLKVLNESALCEYL